MSYLLFIAGYLVGGVVTWYVNIIIYPTQKRFDETPGFNKWLELIFFDLPAYIIVSPILYVATSIYEYFK